MDAHLKKLMQDLGNAINDSLSESDQIAEVIGEIKEAGYNVFLVMEATIGFNKREVGEGEKTEEQPEARPSVPETKGPVIKFTTQDHRFARAIKMDLNDPDDPNERPQS